MDGRTDRQTDGRCNFNMPPKFLRGHNKNLVKIQKVEEAFKNNEAPVFVFRCVNSVVHNIFSDGSVAVNNVCCSLK